MPQRNGCLAHAPTWHHHRLGVAEITPQCAWLLQPRCRSLARPLHIGVGDGMYILPSHRPWLVTQNHSLDASFPTLPWHHAKRHVLSTWNTKVSTHMSAHMSTQVSTHMSIHVCLHTCLFTLLHTCLPTCLHTCLPKCQHYNWLRHTHLHATALPWPRLRRGHRRSAARAAWHIQRLYFFFIIGTNTPQRGTGSQQYLFLPISNRDSNKRPRHRRQRRRQGQGTTDDVKAKAPQTTSRLRHRRQRRQRPQGQTRTISKTKQQTSFGTQGFLTGRA